MSYYKDENEFIVYSVNKEELDSANLIVDTDFSSNDFNLNGKTVTNNRNSRVAGVLGEIVFKNYFGERATQSPRGNYPYDFTMDGYHIDIKCKCRNVTPKPMFEASVYSYQLTKHFDSVDYYVFMSTTPDFSKVWFCGYIGKDDWKNNEHGKLWREGEVDESNGLYIKKDTWSVHYRYLTKFD